MSDSSLRLDETGADFVSTSEIHLVGEFGDDEPAFDPSRPRKFIFDRPFLIALKEPQTSHPYFLAWIANDELMEAFSE